MEKRIVYLGDIHGSLNVINKINLSMRDFHIIQVGDFGAGMIYNQEEKLNNLDSSLGGQSNKLYVIRGNHDNPHFWNEEHNFENIRFVKDFEVLDIEGVKHLFIGGATSIDRKHRTEGFSYWKEEPVPFINPSRFEGILPEVIVTHTSPISGPPFGFNHLVYHYASNDHDLLLDLSLERNELNKVFEVYKGKPIKWFYGHFHMPIFEVIEGITFRCLDIDETFVGK